MNTITEELERLCLDDLEGDIDSAIERLRNLKAGHGDKSIELRCSRSIGGWYVVLGTRPETKEEADKRLATEEKARSHKLREYHKLKKELGL